MDDFLRSVVITLFPLAVVFAAMVLSASFSPVPDNSVYLDLNFSKNRVDVAESWVIESQGQSRVYRRLPTGHPFSNLSLSSVSCPEGDAYTSYNGQYVITCRGELSGKTVLNVEYSLNRPYECYEDMCFFRANFFDRPSVKYIEVQLSEVSDFTSYPHMELRALKGSYDGTPGALRISVSLPVSYSDTYEQGNFQGEFEATRDNYQFYTRLDSEWLENLLLIVAFESFLVFMGYLASDFLRSVEPIRPERAPPSKRPLHLVARLFFPDLSDKVVVEATLVDLAARGYLEFTDRHLEIVKISEEPVEKEVLEFLSRVAKDGKIYLDRDWLGIRIDEIGHSKFQKMLDRVYSAEIPRKIFHDFYDPLVKNIVLLMQAAFAVLPLVGMAALPAFLVDFRISAILLSMINFFWLFIALRLDGLDFYVFSEVGAVEKSKWMGLRRLIRSRMSLQKVDSPDWDYLLAFAVLFFEEETVIDVAEERGESFTNIKHPHAAVQAFDMIVRAAN